MCPSYKISLKYVEQFERNSAYKKCEWTNKQTSTDRHESQGAIYQIFFKRSSGLFLHKRHTPHNFGNMHVEILKSKTLCSITGIDI